MNAEDGTGEVSRRACISGTDGSACCLPDVLAGNVVLKGLRLINRAYRENIVISSASPIHSEGMGGVIDVKNRYLLPEEAVHGILGGGGIPVLAHPAFGNGDELILGEEMEERLLKLLEYGLQGMEVFYSGFSPKLRSEMLALAEKYDLYVTAGSDYHGKNKLVELGDTHLDTGQAMPEGMKRFLEDVCDR